MAEIVIVEDEGIVALDIKRHLENYGYSVPSMHASGEAAVAAIIKQAPDLVLMDISLQGEMDGLQAAAILREEVQVPVILLTAYADEQTIERAKIAAPFGYIIKPFEARELRTTIEMALHRAELERKLHESEERYRRFFQDDLSADVVCDSGGRIRDCNLSYLDLFGFSSNEEAVGININTLFRDRDEEERFWSGIHEDQGNELAEFFMRRMDGKELIVRANIVPRYDPSGTLQEINGFIFDTTRLKELEDQLRQAQKMEAIGRLAGGVAHDFNNILTVIMGYTTILDEKVKEGEDISTDVEGIKKASQKATALTRQLLAFSRRQVLRPKLVDLNELVKEMEKMLQRLVSEDVTIHIHPEALGATVFVDPGQIEQVLMNLVVNARDAMPEGGSVTIKTEDREFQGDDSTITGIISPGEYICLSVEDTGTGISEEDREKIFEPFFTTKPDDKGTGLGLATVYGIIKQSKGYIQVDSGKGRGSIFKVYIPLSTEKVSKEVDSTEQYLDLRGKETILLVEDEEGLLELMERILVKYGYTVLKARNGGEALLVMEKRKGGCDLMISDLIMPHMDGKELADRLQQSFSNLAVLFISGYPERTTRERGIAIGDKPFLRKPFSPGELLGKIRSILG